MMMMTTIEGNSLYTTGDIVELLDISKPAVPEDLVKSV